MPDRGAAELGGVQPRLAATLYSVSLTCASQVGALALLAGFRQRQMREQAIGRSAVPVHRIRRDIDRIARVQHLRLLALETDPADTRQTEERLPNWMGMPRGARARCKRNNRTSQARRRLGGD